MSPRRPAAVATISVLAPQAARPRRAAASAVQGVVHAAAPAEVSAAPATRQAGAPRSTPPPPQLEACATRLVSVAPLLMREFRAEMRRSAPADLSVPLFRSLILAGNRPGASVSDLASHLGVTLPTASVAVAKLTARGLLATPGQGERRKLLLTPAGADLVERARADATAAFERRLEHLSSTTLQQIDDALRALEAALGGASRRHVGVASHASQTRSDQPAARQVDAPVCSTDPPLDPA